MQNAAVYGVMHRITTCTKSLLQGTVIFLVVLGTQHTDVQQTIRKMELLGKAPLQGKRTPLGRMKLGGSFLVKDPSKATEECNICGFKSTIKGITFESIFSDRFD